MAFWAQSAGNPPPGVAPVGKATPDASYYEDLDARDKYAQALAAATSWGPSAQATYAAPSTISGVNEGEVRAIQDANMARLEAIANGTGGGVAAPTAYANLAAAGRANNAYAAGHTAPGGIAASMRTAGHTNNAMGARSEATIAAMKAQEQLAAQNALTSGLAGMRAQDFGIAAERARLNAQNSLANAGFAQSNALANQEAWQKQQAIKRGALGQKIGYDAGAFANDMARRRAAAGDANWRSDLEFNKQQRADARDAAYMNTAAQGIGHLANAADDDKKKTAATSDRRQKTQIKSADEQLKELFDSAFGDER